MNDVFISRIYENNEITFDDAVYLIKNFCKKVNGKYISSNFNDNIEYIIKILKIEDILYFMKEGKYCCSFTYGKSKEGKNAYKQEHWEQLDGSSYKESLVMLMSKMLIYKNLY